MPLSRDSRQERKVKAILRARHRLRQRLETIDWEEDVLLPVAEALKAGKPVQLLGLDADSAFDIEVVDEDPRSTQDENAE